MPDHEWIVTPPTCWAAMPAGAVTATFPSPVYFFRSSEMMYLNRKDLPVPGRPWPKDAASFNSHLGGVDLVGRQVLFFRRRGPGRELDLGLLAARREEALEGASPIAGLKRQQLPLLPEGPSGAPEAPPPCSGADAHDVFAVLLALRRADAADGGRRPAARWAWRRRWRRSSYYQTRRRPACRRRRAR